MAKQSTANSGAKSGAKSGAVRPTLTVRRRPDGVAIVTMDVPGESTNTLQANFADEFGRAFEALLADKDVLAVVFTSGKKDSFIAGADIRMLDAVTTEAEGSELSATGQKALDRLASSSKPIVAAIHGACLGGGLEVALACQGRVASDHRSTKLGVPECQLGLLPGAGGTQRLPALIGVQAGLDLLLTGKQVPAKKALAMGLVDEVVHPSIVVDIAAVRALELARAAAAAPESWAHQLSETLGDRDALTELALTGNPLGRRVLFDQARKKLHSKTRGNYPAQDAILDVVRLGFEKGAEAGYAAEAKAFGRLLLTAESRALRSIFFATQALKRDSGVKDRRIKAREVKRVGVLGAGLMGAGIAYVSAAKAGSMVRLKDRDADGVLWGLRYVRDILDKSVKRRRLQRQDADQTMAQVQGTTTYDGFRSCDVVIEAVFEDLELKQQMVRDVESAAGDRPVIFASNTSSLPIARIAEASAHPETVVGMHYFSPVHKMPLLEIITTAQTADWVTATVVALGKKQGKTVIVVGDGPGFYTTRILGPFINEAAYLLADGVSVERIDRALLDFGFPLGPLKLTDEVGIDVGAKVGKVLLQAFGDRMRPPAGMDKLLADGRKGRKSGKGFYLYGDAASKKKGKASEVDESVYAVLGVKPTNKDLSANEIAWRCTAMMVNEAARCLEEGILRSARDGDIGAIFGLGFPPFRGGPFRLVDHEGAASMVKRLRRFEREYGPRFAPAPSLVRLAEKGGTFHTA